VASKKIIQEKKKTLLDGKSLDMRVFWSVLLALLITIVLCSLIMFNIMLLGEFLFVYFLAFVTSVSLRQGKDRIALSFEHAMKNDFSLIKGSYVYRIGSEIWYLCNYRDVGVSV